MTEGPKHENALIKVIVFATAISFGVLGAIITSMRGFFHGEVGFHFSILSIVGFLIGVVAGWGFWKLVFRGRAKNPPAA
jgi:phage-related holin